MEEKINKLYKLGIVLTVMVAVELLLSFTSVLGVKTLSSSKTSTQNGETSDESYDVSAFNTLSTKGVVDLFNDKTGTYVVYLGRSTCSACVSFIPTLKAMQSKYNYVTQYLDITTVNSGTDDYNNLMEKLSTEVTLTVNGETSTKKFGEYFGYTPMTFIIKNGKFADGIVGAYSESKFQSFLNKNGIK